MNINQVAAQLYTVREFTKTPKEIAASLKKIRAIGYQAVQASALGPIADDELARILNGEGLTLCATHESTNDILANPQKVAARLNRLGCRHTALGYPSGIRLDTLADVQAFAKQLNTAGKALRDNGVALSYHNHHMEFRRIDGRVLLEILHAETDPRYVQAELDTYWVQYGGGDPADWCRRMKGRLPLLHMKDFAISKDNQITYAEVGNGNLNWRAIIPAAEASGCEWFIVEQDACPGDPFESLWQSFNYLKDNFCK